MALKPITLKGEQKKILFLNAKNPLQIKGVAGSGKTTVALYRAKHLLETYSEEFGSGKLAIFVFNKTLVSYISALLPYIKGGYRKDSDQIYPSNSGLDIQVFNFHKWAYKFITENGYSLQTNDHESKIINDKRKIDILNNIIDGFSEFNISKKKSVFFAEEISWIKGKLFNTKEEYVFSSRTGRGTLDRVTAKDKAVIWDIYKLYQEKLRSEDRYDFDDFAPICLKILESKPELRGQFTHIIIDEAQDMCKSQILVISKLVSERTNSITIIADAAQKIYKSGFSWSEVGLNVRGARTVEFKKDYRNSKSILNVAISLLDKEKDKSDFTKPEIALCNSLENNIPVMAYFSSKRKQYEYIVDELNKLKDSGNLHSSVILHKRAKELSIICYYLEQNGFKSQLITNGSKNLNFEDDMIYVCTLSSVKGLEFDNVFIVDLNDNIIPITDFYDNEDELTISTERKLLYTAITRAKKTSLFVI